MHGLSNILACEILLTPQLELGYAHQASLESAKLHQSEYRLSKTSHSDLKLTRSLCRLSS